MLPEITPMPAFTS